MFCHQCGNRRLTDSKFCHQCGSSLQASQHSDVAYIRSPKYRRRGLFFLIFPPAGFITVLLLYAIAKFTLESLDDPSETVASVINIAFSLFGIVFTVGILVGIPIGIIFLAKRELAHNAAFDERSGKGDKSVVPHEIKGWNWGAAGLPIIWGLYHSVWISLLQLIPLFNYIWWIVMGINGNEWAWRKNKWVSVEQFKQSQKKWKPWGIAIFVLIGLLFLVGILGALSEAQNGANQAAKEAQMQQNVSPMEVVGQADYSEGYKAGYADGRTRRGDLGDNYLPPATEERRPSYASGYLDGFLKGCREGNYDCSAVERAIEELPGDTDSSATLN